LTTNSGSEEDIRASGVSKRYRNYPEMLAERQGFEPWIPVKVYTLSKRAPSATRPSLR
jgi:hypothetical protein